MNTIMGDRIPSDVGDRIRALLRERDYQSAAAYAEAVLASLGLAAPELRTGATSGTVSGPSALAADAHDGGDRDLAAPPGASRSTLATGPTVSARMGSIFGDEADGGGHPSY